MRSPLLLSAIFVAAAGCAPATVEPRFKDTFAQEVTGRTAGQAQSCISPFGNQNLRVVNPQMVAYGSGPIIYVNRLRAPCPSLEPHNITIIESNGGQYCSGDHLRGLEPGGIIPGPVCLLGEWTPYRR
jgi:hypothetical protein